MTVNPFIDPLNWPTEQALLNDLVVESIAFHGLDFYFLPRANRNLDHLYGEDAAPEFTSAFLLEMYVKSFTGFEGEGDLFSKFGLTIHDQLHVQVARTRFEAEVTPTTQRPRPFEGDLLWFPLNQKLFEIKFVEHEEVFYQLGALQFYTLKCELIEYTNQRITTGVAIIDDIYQNITTDEMAFAVTNEEGNYLVDESGNPITHEHDIDQQNFQTDDNKVIQEQANTIIDKSEKNIFNGEDF